MGGVLETLLKNWEQVGIGAFLMLLLVGFAFLFFTDKLLSPKSVERIVAENLELKKANDLCEGKCEVSDKAVQKAAAELADARVLYVKADAQLEHMQRLDRIKDQEISDLRGRLGRLEGELEGLRRWLVTQHGPSTAGDRA